MAKSRYNIERLRKKFAEFDKIAKEDIKIILSSSAQNIVVASVGRARSQNIEDNGKLIQSIGKEEKNNGFKQIIYVGEEYAPFHEFGTGLKVKIPVGFHDLASKFIGGKHIGEKKYFDEFLENITDWVERKGIATGKDAKKAGYLIAMSILKKGIKPRPFLIPAFIEERDKIPEKMDKMLQRSARNFNKD